MMSTLPYTAEVLSSVVAGYNRAIWPAPIIAGLLALALLLTVWHRDAGSGAVVVTRLTGIAVVTAWLWTGAVFFGRHAVAIDFMAPVYAAQFLLQALLLAWSRVGHSGIALQPPEGSAGWTAATLLAYAVIGYPLLAVIVGDGLVSAHIVGVAPGPTAVLTLGLLLAGRAPRHLAVLPVIWTLIAGGLAWELGIAEEMVLPVLGVAAAVFIVKTPRPQGAA
jgi:hypothetical protein